MSGWRSNDALRNSRPMRPKPLIATRLRTSRVTAIARLRSHPLQGALAEPLSPAGRSLPRRNYSTKHAYIVSERRGHDLDRVRGHAECAFGDRSPHRLDGVCWLMLG